MSARGIALGLLIIALLGGKLDGAEAVPPADVADGPLKFRKVFVPADQVDQWPRGATRYVPVKAEEFQRLLSTAAERSENAGAPLAGRLVAARYTARLTDDGLLKGEMQLDVRHDAQDPVLVPLTPCGIAMSDTRWIDDKKSRPAVVGIDQEGILRLVVAQRGTLHANWALRGEREPSGDLSFTLSLPAVSSSRLLVDLPRAVMPWVELGAVSEAPGGAVGDRRWQIDLGGRPATRLLLVPADSKGGPPQAVARQNLVYDFSSRGMELSARLTLDLGSRPVDQVSVELSAGLQLLDARMGDTVLTWSRRMSRPGQPVQIALEFPEPLAGVQRVVQLRAVAPLRPGQRHTLPTVTPQGVFWQEATATLLIPKPLTLGELDLSGCRQSKVEPLAGADGQALTLQCYAPDARIELRIDRPEPALAIAATMFVELNPRETRGRWTADCNVAESERFALGAVVVPGWQIDQVETEPVGGVEHWSTVKHAGETHLLVRFARAVTPKRPLRLTVNGRLAESALARPLANSTLRMIEVDEAAWQQRLTALTAGKPHQLRVTGDEELTRVDPSKLDNSGRVRLGSFAPDLMYRDDNGARRLQASLARQAAGHAADIFMTLHVRGGLLEESAVIACRPDSGGLERLLVHASQVRSQPFQWSISDDAAARLGARRLSDVQQREAGYSSGETWEISLDRSRTAAFKLLARRTLPLTTGAEATLLAVAPVAEQHGMVTVRSDAGEPLQVDNLRLLPIPTENVPPEQLNTARASYRYDPERDAVLAQSMLLLSRPQPGTLLPSALVWKSRYDVQCNTDGRSNHRVVMQVENRGRRQIRVELPPGAELEQVMVDGVSARRLGDGNRHSALVELAAEKRFPTVRLDYVSRDSDGGSWRRLTPLLPTVDVDILRWEGTVWTPPAERVLWTNGSAVGASAPSWLTRLAGPLARPAAERPFNPFSGPDWRGLVDGTLPANQPSAPARPAADSLPWIADSEETPAGWTPNRVELGAGAAPAVVVMREPLWVTASWSFFLLTLLALWWLFPRGVRAWGALISLLAVTALLTPSFVAPVATTLLIAACCAALLTWVVPGGPRWLTAADLPADESWTPRSGASLPSTFSQPTRGSSLGRSLSIWLVLGSTVLFAAAPRAPSQAEDPRPAAPPLLTVYTVLVPIDKDRQPSGDTWYVPLELYRALTARAAAHTVERHGWLITGAQYRGRLEWNVTQTRVQMTELSATYDVEVFGRQTQLRFPLTRDSVALLPAGALLDGRNVEPVWDQRGQGMLVDVAEPGRHRIELALKPAPREAGGADIELSTPALPTATLELAMPSPAPQIEVPSARGPVEADDDASGLIAKLGGTEKLTIRWSQPSGNGGALQPEIDQLVWLKIAPGAVTLEARLLPHGFEGRLPQMTLRVDPCLRVLGAATAGGPVESRVLPGSPQTVILESARGFAPDEEVTLSLRWVDASGLGRMRSPLVLATEARAVNAWLAVAVDKSLTFETPRITDLSPAAPADLPPRWQPAGAVPDLIYRLPRGGSSWSIATEPRAPESTAEQTLALSLAADTAEVRYVARIDTTSGALFSHRLRVPKDLIVTRVELTQDLDQTDRVAQWSLTNGLLRVFLNRPVTGRQRLTVRGNWPLEGQNVPMPAFQLEDGRQQSLELAIYRRAGIDVQATDAEALHEMSEPTMEMLRLAERVPRWFGRQVGFYNVVNPHATTIFKVRPAPPQFAATQTTTLSRQEGVWQAEVDYRLQVSSGAVDTIRFLLPASLRGPLTITPVEPFAIVEMPGQRQRQLVIRPREAVRDRLRLTIAAPLVFAAGERVAAPVVEPLDAASVAQFLILPKQVEQERVEWELRGLERQTLPPDGDSPPPAAATVNTYRVMGQRFQAALASVAKIERAPRIRLADIRVKLDGTGEGSGVVSFDLEPAGLSQCVLTTPLGVRPIRATVGSLPMALVALEENKWELSLISNQLPQRVEIVFQGTVSGQPGAPLSAPWLAARGGPVEVTQTLWTVYAPRGTSLSASHSQGAPITAVQQQWQRLDSLSAMLSEASADESADILARWYEPWAGDLSEAWRAISSLRSPDDPAAEATAEKLLENRRQHEQIATRLRTLDVLEQAQHAATPAQPGVALWQWASPTGGATAPLRATAGGALPALRVESRAVLSRDLTARLLLSALFGSAIVMLLWPRSSRRITALLNRWPFGLAALGALLCWLLLSPGAWGLALAILMAAAAWRMNGDLGEPGSSAPGAFQGAKR